MPLKTIGRWTAGLAVCALAALWGCGSGPAKSGALAKDESHERIKKAGVLKFGFDPSGGAPFADKDAKTGEVTGFEVDMMNKICAHMSVKAEMISNQWDSLIPDLNERRTTDLVMNGVEIIAEREEKVLFSKPYYVYRQQLAVRAADKDKYKKLDDLKGKKIATLSGAEANNVLKRAGWPDAELQKMQDSQQPYDELMNGRVEAVLQENIITAYYVPKYEGALHAVAETFAPGKYGIAFRKEDRVLADAVDLVLEKMKSNGELAEIYKKWKLWNSLQAEIGVNEKP